MNVSRGRKPRIVVLFIVLSVGILLACFALVSTQSASAVPTTMNFQGRLADAGNNTVADGLYNMQFRLFTVSSGGSATWTETRETTNRVQVTNGLFAVQLGAVTPLSASLFSGNDVYFEITLPTPGTATCGTASCASWESPMTPRQKMATSAYAFQAENANTLDGLDSTAFAAATGSANYIQNTTSPQTGDFNITGTGTAATLQATTLDRATAGTLTIGGTNATGITLADDTSVAGLLGVEGVATFRNTTDSSSALRIQNAAGASLLNANTTDMTLSIGSADGSDARLYIAAKRLGDGFDWAYNDIEENSWSSVAYGDGLFVAVSSSGDNRFAISADGIDWTPQSAAENNSWHSVAYGDGLFVAVSSGGTNRVMTSSDGITWTPQSAAENNQWRHVIYGDGLFVAVSSSGTNRVMTSPDGITWTSHALPTDHYFHNLQGIITYGNGKYLATGYDNVSGDNVILSSSDGATWTASAVPSDTEFYHIAYGDGKFVTVGFDYDNGNSASYDQYRRHQLGTTHHNRLGGLE